MSLFVVACATAPPLPPETGEQDFIIERDLVGASNAKGVFRAINGVNRPFEARLSGRMEGDTFILVEDFVFADGEHDRKTWRLRRVSDERYEGVREDVVGVAQGWQDGRAFRLEYDIRLPAKDGGQGRKVRFRDVMVRTDEGVILNRATVGYFGFKVGSVELTIAPGAP